MNNININKVHSSKSDDFNTPIELWKKLSEVLNNDSIDLRGKKILDPFYNDGSAKQLLQELFKDSEIIHEDKDYFNTVYEYDILISNLPFSKLRSVFKKLFKDDKPFIVLVPLASLSRKYMQSHIKDVNIVLLKNIKWEGFKHNLPVQLIFLCYKIDLKTKVINY